MERIKLTDAQARQYIMGEEPFDKSAWEQEHILRLRDAVEKALATTEPCYLDNLRRTCAKYIENHKDTTNRNELRDLIATYEKVLRRCEEYEKERSLAAETLSAPPKRKQVTKHKKTSFSR